MKKLIMPLLVVLPLSGCINQERQNEAIAYVNSHNPLTFNKEDCDSKWELTEYAISQNAAGKIQTSTNTTIDTYNIKMGYVTLSTVAHKLSTKTGCRIEVSSMLGYSPDYIRMENILRTVEAG